MSVICKEIIVFSFLNLCYTIANAGTPIVLWHSEGDIGVPRIVDRATELIRQNLPGVYVLPLQLGNSKEDVQNSYFKKCNDQVTIVCQMLRENVQLENGYIGVGFSIGGVLLRAVAERCPYPPMRKLITLGSAHQGIFNIGDIHQLPIVVDFYRQLLIRSAYTDVLQNHFTLANLWHTPYHEDVYKLRNNFLPDINNENYINPTYAENLMRLQKLVLVKFANNTIIIPKGSQWFGYYRPNQTKEEIPLEQTRLYIQERLGLKTMIQQKKVDFVSVPNDHLKYTDSQFIALINKYMRD